MSETTPEERARTFLATRKTLEMATVDTGGRPTASQAPYIYSGGTFYVYTSGLSRHTDDLLKTKKVSILLVEDEVSAQNIFARKRITFSCRVATVRRDSAAWREVIGLFRNAFGPVFDVIEPLRDFTLFRLTPKEAIYVEGFGRAYRMTGNLKGAVHVKGTGPGAKVYKGKREPEK